MAKRRTKVLPARKPARSRDDDSLLMRSAESLGRVVGSLQRQMLGTTKRVSRLAQDAIDALPQRPATGSRASSRSSRNGVAARKTTGAATRKRAAARKTSRSRKTATRPKTSSR